jgi:hypothetical protein
MDGWRDLVRELFENFPVLIALVVWAVSLIFRGQRRRQRASGPAASAPARADEAPPPPRPGAPVRAAQPKDSRDLTVTKGYRPIDPR